MPINTFTKSDLKNKDFTAEYTIKRNKRTISGNVVDGAQTESAKILKSMEFFHTNGTVEPQNSTVDVNEKARKMIECLGLSFVKPDGDSKYSLLNGMRDKGNILTNPNISDINKLKTLESKKIAAIDKFPDTSDAFYVLDENPSQAVQQLNDHAKMKNQHQNNISLAAAFYEINVVNTSEKTLKQFKK
tara:strand:+ start:2495 stop:3058 length:564 start_codon:yes stop_codon:yes gene_type:complete